MRARTFRDARRTAVRDLRSDECGRSEHRRAAHGFRIGNPPVGTDLGALEAIASQAGSQIGMLRVMSATTLQAATDPLTGMLNRRSLENKVHEMIRRGTPFTLAMGDLDHFKRLNDTHGHDAGDRALRLFARTTLRVLRAEDLICRFGGEEFVFVFPDRTVHETVGALERLTRSATRPDRRHRARVHRQLRRGTLPSGTLTRRTLSDRGQCPVPSQTRRTGPNHHRRRAPTLPKLTNQWPDMEPCRGQHERSTTTLGTR